MSARILVLPDGRPAWASDLYPGSIHDVATLDASGLLEEMDPSGWITDKGYIGRGMIMPQKKLPNGELSEAANEANKSMRRIRADHRPHQVLENLPAPTAAAPCAHSSRPSPPHSHSTSSEPPRISFIVVRAPIAIRPECAPLGGRSSSRANRIDGGSSYFVFATKQPSVSRAGLSAAPMFDCAGRILVRLPVADVCMRRSALTGRAPG